MSPSLLTRGCLLTFALLATVPARAQDPDWAKKMFDRLNVDFGTVAKGSEVMQRLKIRNIYKETVQIQNVSTSCGCSHAQKSTDSLASGEEGYIELKMDTVKFSGHKDSSVTVALYEPITGARADVRVPLKAYIRTDVVFTPSAAQFGNIDLGKGGERKITVAYSGRPDWKIVEIKANHPSITTKVAEVSRLGSEVRYELTVQVSPTASIGEVRDQVTLITNDAQAPNVPLVVAATVESDITLTPDVLTFGTVTPGQSKTVNLVVRGKKPFSVERIERTKDDDSFKVKLPSAANNVHVLPITFICPTDAANGQFNEVFTINIAGRAEPLTFRAKGQVNAPTSAAPAAAAAATTN